MNSLQKIADTSAIASSTQSKAGTIVSQHMNLQNTHMTLQENQRDFPNLSIPQMNSSVRTSGIFFLLTSHDEPIFHNGRVYRDNRNLISQRSEHFIHG